MNREVSSATLRPPRRCQSNDDDDDDWWAHVSRSVRTVGMTPTTTTTTNGAREDEEEEEDTAATDLLLLDEDASVGSFSHYTANEGVIVARKQQQQQQSTGAWLPLATLSMTTSSSISRDGQDNNDTSPNEMPTTTIMDSPALIKQRLSSIYRPRHVAACHSNMSLLSVGSAEGGGGRRFVAPNISFTPHDIIMMEWDTTAITNSTSDPAFCGEPLESQRIETTRHQQQQQEQLQDLRVCQDAKEGPLSSFQVPCEKRSEKQAKYPIRSTVSCDDDMMDQGDDEDCSESNNKNDERSSKPNKAPLMFGHSKRERSSIFYGMHHWDREPSVSRVARVMEIHAILFSWILWELSNK